MVKTGNLIKLILGILYFFYSIAIMLCCGGPAPLALALAF